MTDPKSEMVTIRMSKAERAIAERVAEHHGLNVASLVRMMIRQKAREIGAAEPKPTK